MLEAAATAAIALADPLRLGFLALGVVIGLFLGVIPGLGGLVGLSLLLPFTFTMDPFTALAFLMGLQAVVVTSDTIPAVLFGVPGTIGSAATILDGYPMSQKGEAGRAFGAAFTASVMGGLFGALVLALSIPIIRPIILEIGSPELFAICVFGLSLVAVLSGTSPLKGLAAACIGMLISTAGDDAQTATLRWTFDTIYLYDGLPIVPLALGLFAIPEIADLVVARRSISGNRFVESRWAQLEGVKDVFRNKFLLLRCSTIGSTLGAVPGIGSAVIDWIAYGHAARTSKGAERTFGKGDVRGVIASESSNNAKEGGALLPTLAFGVPGSASMALILGAFLIHGLVPGPEMLTKRLDITYTLVWSVAAANILGAGLCFLFANQLAKIALVRIGILAPAVLAITYVGAFQGHRAWGDLYVLILFGLFGWVMKRLRWPRPPLILGFVLGGLVERYLFISVDRYGWEWLWIFREGELVPWVTIILAATLYGALMPVIRMIWTKRTSENPLRFRLRFNSANIDWDMAISLLFLALFIYAVFGAADWGSGARLMPQLFGLVGAGLMGILIFSRLFLFRSSEVGQLAESRVGDPSAASLSPSVGGSGSKETEAHFDIQSDFGDLPAKTIGLRIVVYFGWLLLFLGGAALIGLLPAMLVFLLAYIRFEGRESWRMTLSVALPISGFSYALFHWVMDIPWPKSVLGDLIPVLRSAPWLNLF